MNFIYAFLISFMMIFISELGDKTQLIVLSFCNKLKSSSILLGVAIGTFLSHGVAILFGSSLGLLNDNIKFYLSIITYSSFLLFGIFGFLHKEDIDNESISSNSGGSIKNSMSNLKMHYILLIASSICIGELGDKTFLASLGLGIEYPHDKISLILGSVCGMVGSNSIALVFGKFLGHKINPKYVQFLSNLLFIVFGVIGFVKLFF